MEDTTRHGAEVSIDIINTAGELIFSEVKDTLHKVMHPIISNAMYFRDKEVLMNERMRVIRDLARALDNENFEKAIKELGYTVIDSQGKMSC